MVILHRQVACDRAGVPIRGFPGALPNSEIGPISQGFIARSITGGARMPKLMGRLGDLSNKSFSFLMRQS